METALCSDGDERRDDTGVESDVYECLFTVVAHTSDLIHVLSDVTMIEIEIAIVQQN